MEVLTQYRVTFILKMKLTLIKYSVSLYFLILIVFWFATEMTLSRGLMGRGPRGMGGPYGGGFARGRGSGGGPRRGPGGRTRMFARATPTIPYF
ncbi:Hypothetical protein SRAE_X000124900 [Strongyloides ratti]|uniref:Uncharacterized protein n=1 Tax=Strongyloides ratti TaxID=34506 RepID=A0A090KUF3_STRRB|nr:Hypothetical protein SRAE_X000124800 [Strongyloides ratti]XP_024498712.1 Hypothetical protein SRAE_X000124900 [Strongyloides ratti]CEF59500.1 Hypothetical protein SRAE_X000124800 [Strongyloides ratti]CEF59501.1 Hypothetical protein SRAE_X000124900 [Strongyloides ratti]